MGFTNSAVNTMLSSTLGSVQVALFRSAPSDTGTGGDEPSNSSYERAPAELKPTTGAEKQVQNHKIIQFNIARGDGWGTITHVGLYKSGTLMFWDELESPVTVSGNTIPVFDIGELIIGIDRPDDELAAPNPVPPTN